MDRRVSILSNAIPTSENFSFYEHLEKNNSQRSQKNIGASPVEENLNLVSKKFSSNDV